MLGDRYPRGGGPVTLYRLLDLMIRFSDNTAADALMRLVGGPTEVTAWLGRHDIHDLRARVARTVFDAWSTPDSLIAPARPSSSPATKYYAPP